MQGREARGCIVLARVAIRVRVCNSATPKVCNQQAMLKPCNQQVMLDVVDAINKRWSMYSIKHVLCATNQGSSAPRSTKHALALALSCSGFRVSGFRFTVYGLRFTVWPYLVDIAKVQDARGVYHNVGIVTGLQAVAARNLRWHNAVPPSEG